MLNSLVDSERMYVGRTSNLESRINEHNTGDYNHYNGAGTAEKVIEKMRGEADQRNQEKDQ